MIRRGNGVLWLFLLPAVIVLFGTQLIPLVYSGYLALLNWSLENSPTPEGFYGLANFVTALKDAVFVHSLVFSATLAICVTAVELFVGFTIAYMTRRLTFMDKTIRVIFTIPMAIAPIAVAAIWRVMLTPGSGLVNQVLSMLGFSQVNWLGEPRTAILILGWIDVWQWSAFTMVIYAAGLASLPRELLEAASVDGASAWISLWKVIVPSLRSVTWTITIFRGIDAFFIFDSAFGLTGGGPGFSTTTVTLEIYDQGLQYFNISQAAAESWIVLVISMVVGLWILRRRRRGAE